MKSVAVTERAASERRLARVRRRLFELEAFSDLTGMPLRPYQLEAAHAIAASVARRAGLTLTVLMPRQAGKNELSAQVEAFLLSLHRQHGGTLVKCAPTFRPQLHTSIQRLRRVLDRSLARGRWRMRDGYVVEVGAASIAFHSAEPRANVVGATASLLLECDEAQDVEPDKWEREFRPMGATANVTSVLYGTPWPVARSVGVIPIRST